MSSSKVRARGARLVTAGHADTVALLPCVPGSPLGVTGTVHVATPARAGQGRGPCAQNGQHSCPTQPWQRQPLSCQFQQEPGSEETRGSEALRPGPTAGSGSPRQGACVCSRGLTLWTTRYVESWCRLPAQQSLAPPDPSVGPTGSTNYRNTSGPRESP